MLTKGKATETALKQVRGPRILHIATHGFFLEDQPQASNPKRVTEDCRPLKARTRCCARAWRSPGPTCCAQDETMACSPPWKSPGLILRVRS